MTQTIILELYEEEEILKMTMIPNSEVVILCLANTIRIPLNTIKFSSIHAVIKKFWYSHKRTQQQLLNFLSFRLT